MDTLSYKTVSANAETAQKEWVVIDATDQVLGRLCAKVAKILRGKYKPKKIEGNTFGESASVSYDTFGENAYRRFDAGWNIGIGVEISRFIVSLDTQLGFCKLYDSDNAPRNVNIGLLVGYKF